MRKLLQLAIFLSATTLAHAQIVSPDKMVSPPPRNPAQAPTRLTADLQWLWPYTQPAPSGNKSALLADQRFTTLLRENLKAPQAMWSLGTPLSQVARVFLGGEGRVSSPDNRHITITGCVVEHCPQEGRLWIDLGKPDPLVVFAALRWAERSRTSDQPGAPFDLWLFASQPVNSDQVPDEIKAFLFQWLRVERNNCRNAINVSNAVLVEPDGVPRVLSVADLHILSGPCIE